MSIRIGAWAAASLIAASGAWAQPTPAAPPARPDPAASEAAAAMERARRQAAGPLRVIMEASKNRRRPGDDTPDVPAPRVSPPPLPAPVRAAVASPLPVSTAPAQPPAAVPVRSAAVVPEPAAVRPAPAAVAAAPTGPSGVVTEITLSADAMKKPAVVVPEPALPTTGAVAEPTLTPPLPAVTTPLPLPVAAPVARAIPAPAALPPVTPANGRPVLVTRVDPEVNDRALSELGRNAVVAVDLTLRPDGTVALVKPVGSLPRGMARSLTQAMEQWRFAPLADVRVHRIELVFNAE